MKPVIKYLSCHGLTLLTGLILGVVLTLACVYRDELLCLLNSYNFWSGLGAMLAGIGTLGLLLVALWSINSWKKQADLQFLQTTLVKLRDDVADLDSYCRNKYVYDSIKKAGMLAVDGKKSEINYDLSMLKDSLERKFYNVQFSLEWLLHSKALKDCSVEIESFINKYNQDLSFIHESFILKEDISWEDAMAVVDRVSKTTTSFYDSYPIFIKCITDNK